MLDVILDKVSAVGDDESTITFGTVIFGTVGAITGLGGVTTGALTGVFTGVTGLTTIGLDIANGLVTIAE